MMDRPDMTGWWHRHTLRLEEPTILLNKWQRMHWAQKRKYQKDLTWSIRALGPIWPAPASRCRIHIIRANPKPYPDYDGMIGGFKPLLDALVTCGYIEDDSPGVIESLTAMSVIAPRQKGYTVTEIWIPK